MATLRTVTVKSSGGDYTSLSAAEAGEQGDLVTLDRQLDIECYAMADTTAVTVSGWTTDATRYIRVVAPTAERHDGKWDATAYRLAVNAGYGRVLYIQEEFVRFEGVQIWNTANRADNTKGVEISIAGAGDIRIDGCIIRAGTSGTPGISTRGVFIASVGSGTTLRVRNTLVYDWREGISGGYLSPITTIFSNLTVVDNTANGVYMAGSNYTRRWKNVLCQGNGAADYDYSGAGATNDFATCISEDATSPTVALRSQVVTFVDEAGDDFHLASGDTVAKDAGTDLSGDSYWPFAVDIDGETITTWSIGADSIVSGGGITLTVAGLASAATFDAPALTQANVLAAAEMASGVTLDGVALTQAHALVAQAMDSATALDPATLTQAHLLAVAELLAATTLDAPGLTQANVLAPAGLDSAVTMDGVSLTQANVLAVDPLTGATSLEAVVLVQAHVLAPADLGSATSMDAPTLDVSALLIVADLSAGTTLDASTLTQANVLAVVDLNAGTTLDAVGLVQTNVLVADGVLCVTTLDGVVLVIPADLVVPADGRIKASPRAWVVQAAPRTHRAKASPRSWRTSPEN